MRFPFRFDRTIYQREDELLFNGEIAILFSGPSKAYDKTIHVRRSTSTGRHKESRAVVLWATAP